MRTCFLHAGTPKAGSTTLQGFLGVYRANLAARGVDVPDFSFSDVVRGPIALAGALSKEQVPRNPVTEPWRWLDRHLAGTNGNLCISREAFCEHFSKKRRLDFVREFFALRGVRLSVLAHVRDHVGFLNAAYTQQAKKLRLTETFDGWLERILAAPPARASYWRMFRHVLKAEDVAFTLRPLEAVAGDRLVADFAGLIGCGDLDLSGFDPSPYRNATPGPMAVEAGLRIGRALAERGIDPDERPTLARNFDEALAIRGWDEEPFFGPDAAACERIGAAFAEENTKLARRAWRARWEDRVTTTRKPQNLFVSVAGDAAVDELVREIVGRAEERPLWRRLAGRG